MAKVPATTMMMTKMMLTMILTLIIMLLATFRFPDTAMSVDRAKAIRLQSNVPYGGAMGTMTSGLIDGIWLKTPGRCRWAHSCSLHPQLVPIFRDAARSSASECIRFSSRAVIGGGAFASYSSIPLTSDVWSSQPCEDARVMACDCPRQGSECQQAPLVFRMGDPSFGDRLALPWLVC